MLSSVTFFGARHTVSQLEDQSSTTEDSEMHAGWAIEASFNDSGLPLGNLTSKFKV